MKCNWVVRQTSPRIHPCLADGAQTNETKLQYVQYVHYVKYVE